MAALVICSRYRHDKEGMSVVVMQQTLIRKKSWQKTGARMALVLILCTSSLLSARSAWAQGGRTMPGKIKSFPPTCILSPTEPPDFLAAPVEKVPEREKGTAITPFICVDQGLTLLPTPERPSMSTSEEISQERRDVTAGVNVDLGTFNLNLGYTLPSGQVDNLVRPLGVNLEPGSDNKRFSLGVKIPF